MRVVYIGKCNSLASKLVDRLVKEDDQVYIISNQDFIKEVKPVLKYKFYKYDIQDIKLVNLFTSIHPDIVIFAGENYSSEKWQYGKSTINYLAQLYNILNLSFLHNISKFIYLSTNEVYPKGLQFYLEEDMKEPFSCKGELCSNGEDLVLNFQKLHQINIVILRMECIYGFSINEEEHDFLSNMIEEIQREGSYKANRLKKCYPLYIKDCVEAIYRAKGVTPSLIYHVRGLQEYNEVEIIEHIATSQGIEINLHQYEEQDNTPHLNTNKIKKELEWLDYHQLASMLARKEINFERKIIDTPIEKVNKIRANGIILTIENIALFLIFATISFFFRNHSLLNSLDLMILYISSISLLFGVRQSLLSVILSIGFYLTKDPAYHWNIVYIMTNVEFIMTIAQYIFMGIAIGYAVDHYRIIIKEKGNDYEYLNKEFAEIQEINEDNIMIKREYEKRILTYKTSLPKLYSIISKLTVLEPEKIFVEAIDVIKDIMDTDTVAIYLGNEKSSYIRLIASSNEEAIFQGKSIKLDQYPKMMDLLYKNEIFIGTQWDSTEPSLAAPIIHDGKLIAVIIINRMKFSGLNLYQTNMFRTLTVLIASSIIKAMEYETAVHSSQYIEDTEILNVNEFDKLIKIKKDGKTKGIADYCMIKIQIQDNIKETYYKVLNYFRNTDFFGTCEDGELYVLLSNTSLEEVSFVTSRLKNANISAEIIKDSK